MHRRKGETSHTTVTLHDSSATTYGLSIPLLQHTSKQLNYENPEKKQLSNKLKNDPQHFQKRCIL